MNFNNHHDLSASGSSTNESHQPYHSTPEFKFLFNTDQLQAPALATQDVHSTATSSSLPLHASPFPVPLHHTPGLGYHPQGLSKNTYPAPKRVKTRSRNSPHLPAEKNMAQRAAQIAANCPDPGRDIKDRFKCTERNCDKAFLRRYNLKVHARKHTNETPYSCKEPNCGKRFKWRSSMAHHQKSHEAKKQAMTFNNNKKYRTVLSPSELPGPPFPILNHRDSYYARDPEENRDALLPPMSTRQDAGYQKGNPATFPTSPVSSNPDNDVRDENEENVMVRRTQAYTTNAQSETLKQDPYTQYSPNITNHSKGTLATRPHTAIRKEEPVQYGFEQNTSEIAFADLGYPSDHLQAEHYDTFIQNDFMNAQHH